jgi:hypothetical protein
MFADSGKIRIDTPIAPALVGQMVLAYPVIRLFGMNHAFLRAMTWIMAAVCLFCVNRLLVLAALPPLQRLLALLVLLLNPLFLYFANTFMTEFYGFVPGLLAAVVYFEYRHRVPKPFESRRSFSYSIACWVTIGLLSVFSFWTRQFASIIFPIILMTWMFTAPPVPRPYRLRSWLLIAICALIFGAGVIGYFFWARMSGNLSFAFSDPLERTMHVDLLAWRVQTGALIVYLTGFFAPFLVLAPKGRWRKPMCYIVGAALFVYVWIARVWFQSHAPSDFVFDGWMHRVFPYVTNVIYQTGIGPITLDDVYHQAETQRPFWNGPWWLLIEWVLLIGTLLWGFFARRIRVFWKSEKQIRLRKEIACFSTLWTIVAWIVTVQAYRNEIFDRYYFPLVLSLSILVPLLLVEEDCGRKRDYSYAVLAAICTAFLGWFSVAGLHDQFRWNDARWNLANFAFSQGISPADLAGGFEVNGWKNYDNVRQQKESSCRSPLYIDWFCSGDTYRVGMNVRPDYEEVKHEQPSYWLASGPPLRLLRRIEPAVTR